jgi:SAM-dependent methyltransferase
MAGLACWPPGGSAGSASRRCRRGHCVCVDEDLWDAYDRMGLSFRQHAADSAANAHYDRPAVLAALGPVTGRQVSDAVCGPGLYLRELLDRGAEVTAFDASPVMVSLARQQTAGRVRIDQAALGKPLPYPDDAFDLIVCALAIHYASDRAAAFAEFCRVLRPGGAAVVLTQHPVMDWLRKGGSYFQATLETDIWRMPSGDQPVHFGMNRCRHCARPRPMLDSLSEKSSSRSRPRQCANVIPRTTRN